ncbi:MULTISPECIES: HAD family hydrolase [Nocardia]|uniref:HAD family hydrolase n=1 Tax=Nocardia TaxID=1817 RepID=UPI000D687C5F|nr:MULTISPECIES: HAD family hydrolase [Nocardia]
MVVENPAAATVRASSSSPAATPGGDPLPSWREGAAKRAVLDFVERVAAEAVPPEDRVAVFDNDGTLWCEKPMPIQLDFILRRLVAMCEKVPALRTRQPWQAAYTRDYDWLNDVITKHYRGDDSEVAVLASGMLTAFAGVTVEEFEAQADRFLRTTEHPTLARPYTACAYAPMVELLGMLEATGFANYIASGGGRDFMRPISQEMYGIPRERVIGSSVSLAWKDSTVVHTAELDFLDDGPEKPVRIWSRVGRRPLLAVGNTNGDIPMLRFTERDGVPSLRMLVLHDDPDREFDYETGSEQALEAADAEGWTVVSMKDDWSTVFEAR